MRKELNEIGTDEKEEDTVASKQLRLEKEQTFTRTMLYAKKTGIVGDYQKFDINKFLNQQIEDLYLKIEKKIQMKQGDIKFMKFKVEQLDEGDEEGATKDPKVKIRLAKQKKQEEDVQIRRKIVG